MNQKTDSRQTARAEDIEAETTPGSGGDLADSSETAPARTQFVRPLLFTLGIVGILLGMVAWAVSSPAGSSPDEDYHLGSIWCPRPIEGSGCSFEVTNGEITAIEVPQSFHSPTCYAFNAHVSAGCTDAYSDDVIVLSERFDGGMYPFGYYQFEHMFIGDDVFTSVVWMRIMNITLALLGLGTIAAFASPAIRHSLLLATTAAWVPMGIYFVASINPSGWAISGLIIYAAGLYAALEAEGWRKGPLLGAAALGAIMSVTSRSDSAFFVVFVTVAIWLVGARRRPSKAVVGFTVLAFVGAIAAFVTSGQARNATGAGGWPTNEALGLPKLFVANLIELPDYIANFWGLTFGPGWVDVPLSSWSTLGMLFLAGGVVFVGARELWFTKASASLLVVGLLLGVPVVGMTLRHVTPVTYYQARYTLPLLAVFYFIWTLRKNNKLFFVKVGELALIIPLVSAANLWALHRLILRYTQGLDDNPLAGIVRITAVEWWPWSVSPTLVWVGGSLSFAAGITILFILSASSYKSSELSAPPAAA